MTPTQCYLQNLYALRFQSQLRLRALSDPCNVNGQYHKMFAGMYDIESDVLQGLQAEINRVNNGGSING